ncbi:GNAT family N-acetyltransferase [Paenibacillus massiliensis]|uniref:GNAT family N-acetyltransferase n=1 Tax=Paenibacillus massiliensis TaxID=225917 RepID=UPI00046ECD52|nr:GNAT family N-acetyltransferase [Paenibacillus massiliensis]
MRIEQLQLEDKAEFIAYCVRHRSEVDDSFLYEQDLEKFEPDEDNPTLVIKEDGAIIAVASLILDDYHRRGRQGRFRILHSEKPDTEVYALLLNGMMEHIAQVGHEKYISKVECVEQAEHVEYAERIEHVQKAEHAEHAERVEQVEHVEHVKRVEHREGLEKVFLFVPLVNEALAAHVEELHFSVERYVFLLINDMKEIQPLTLPEGYSIRAFQPGHDEEAWCHIRNTAFAQLTGSTTPMTLKMLQDQMSQPAFLEGGMLLLLHEDTPIGIIRGANDEYEGEAAMNIGPLAILPAYQGKGLGRQLLRASLAFANSLDYKKTVLCVNGENERAKALYVQEGFVQVEGVTAYEYYLNRINGQ